jgi:UPF0755 protein
VKLLKIATIVISSFLGLALFAFVVAAVYFNQAIKETTTNDQTQNIIEVKDGESTLGVAKRLKERGLISSDAFFAILAKIKKGSIYAGVYRIPREASILSVYDQLSSGKVTHIKVTIPEGWRTEQIAQVLSKKNLVSYEEFITKAKPFEGKLFPDTYFFPYDTTAENIISQMQDDFTKRTSGLNVSDADIVIASIVEREAVTDEERPLIAGVFKNRIAKGMRLEADPTIQYSKDSVLIKAMPAAELTDFRFWQPITISQSPLYDSPYNTYIALGLPPGPICNPGLASIKATVNSQEHNYLYFLHKDGVIYPSATVEEHNANRAKILGVKIKR